VEVFKKPRLSKKARLFDLPVDEGEKWTRVSDRPKYWVSNKGRFYSEPRFDSKQGNHSGKMLSVTPQTSGYPAVKFQVDGGQESRLVHRVLMEEHGPDRPTQDHTFVNHIDGDIKNYNLSNLEWVRPAENRLHGMLRKCVREYGRDQTRMKIEQWLNDI